MPNAVPKLSFSVIIPCLNEEKYLPLLLKDLHQQTIPDFEVFVVDGNSEDKTVEKAKKFTFAKILSTNKRNVSFQRNLGAKSAKGEFLIFLDADTRIPKYFLEGLRFRLNSKPADVFTTWMSSEGLTRSEKSLVTLINFVMESGSHLDMPTVFGAMIGVRHTHFSKSGGFDESITFAEDGELLTRLKAQESQFRVYRDPRFWFSLRRFKKEGTLPLVQKSARLHLQIFFGGYPRKEQDLYPMLGGEYYLNAEKPETRSRRFLQQLAQKAKAIRSRSDFSRVVERFFED